MRFGNNDSNVIVTATSICGRCEVTLRLRETFLLLPTRLTPMNTLDHRTRVAAEKRERMRMRLIESALHVFAHKGADAAVIEDVIAMAEVSRGTFYNYFRTTEEVMAAVQQDVGNELLSLVDMAIADRQDPAERLACGVRMVLQELNLLPTLTVAEAGLNLFWLDRAVWNLDVNYAQGLRWFGADDDSQQQINNLPKAQFRKYRAGLSQWRNGQFGAQTWQWQSQLNVQYSPDPLPAIEQLLGTDDSAVRGYRVSSASGASGAIWRNTLRTEPRP